jgi:serine/threonine protein kinase
MNAALPNNCARVYAAIHVNESLLLVLERKKGVLLHDAMVSNVSELLEVEYTMADVTQVLYQCASMLRDLHSKIKGFSHNDLKSDNILLTPREGSFAVVFIDAETVRGEGLPSRFLENVDESVLSMFALDGEYCEWLDFHLILLEICFAVRKARPPWHDAFFAMVHSFCPKDLLFTYKEGGQCVTTFNRLTAEGRRRTCECKSLEETMRILESALPQNAHV